MNYIIDIIKAVLATIGAYFSGKRLGKVEAQRDNAEEVVKNVRKINAARADSEYRNSLRDKYK